MKRKLFTSREKLECLYIQENKSTHKIGRLLEIDSKTVWHWLKKYGLSIRSRSEAIKGERNYMYGKQHTEEFKRKISEKLKGRLSPNKGKKVPTISLNHADFSGENNPFYGKKHTDRAKKNISLKKRGVSVHSLKERSRRKEFMKAQWSNQKLRERIVIAMTLAQNRPDVKEKVAEATRRRWDDPDYKQRVLKKTIRGLHKKPNIPEEKMIRLAEKHSLPLEYVGNGTVIINGCNPDFVVSNEKKIIEIFGRTFHDPEFSYLKNIPWERQEAGRKAVFSEVGYDALILWDDELGDEELIIEKVRGFING